MTDAVLLLGLDTDITAPTIFSNGTATLLDPLVPLLTNCRTFQQYVSAKYNNSKSYSNSQFSTNPKIN